MNFGSIYRNQTIGGAVVNGRSSAKRQPPCALHPRAFAADNLLLTIGLSVLGAIVGIQVLVTLGITPNTSLIGALVAMALARIPLRAFFGFRSIHSQNLAQTSISAATFGAANCLFLPIGIPYLFGRPNLVVPVFVGVCLAMLLDGFLLYRLFGSRAFPVSSPWPIGVAAAEAIKAGDQGGSQAGVLLGGTAVGIAGALAGLPMAALGVALIGGVAAMAAFSTGLLLRGYSPVLFQFDIAGTYIPHGVMIGAGLVALLQVSLALMARPTSRQALAEEPSSLPASVPRSSPARVLRMGALGYVAIAILLAVATGMYTSMSTGMLLLFVLYAAFSAFVHELIVGIAAMHSGWFPAFAVALISLLIGMMIGFPPEALVVLVAFSVATGPAFADMGYDFKTGFLLRGEREHDAFELEGRRQQWLSSLIGFFAAIVVVALSHGALLEGGFNVPINATYIAAIKAGISADVARELAIWAVPGVLLQLLGGPRRQIGVLFATGLLITNAAAGWMVAVGLLIRFVISRSKAKTRFARGIEVAAGGVIAGDALTGFAVGAGRTLLR